MRKDERKDVEMKIEALSISKRAAEAGVPYTTYWRRIDKGFSEEELNRKPGVFDHKGQRFPTIRHMCDQREVPGAAERSPGAWDIRLSRR